MKLQIYIISCVKQRRLEEEERSLWSEAGGRTVVLASAASSRIIGEEILTCLIVKSLCLSIKGQHSLLRGTKRWGGWG